MRFLLSFKLDNGAVLSFVTDAQNMNISKNQALQLSNMLFKDDIMRLKPTNAIVHSERWGKDKVKAYRPGEKNYSAAFVFNGQPQYVNTDGSGLKSAYNNIVCKFALSNDTPMFIFELNQNVMRKDAIVKARQIIQSGKALSDLSRTVGRVMQSDQRLICYMESFGELVQLLKDYKSRRYTSINPEKLIGLVGAMVYVSDTSNYSLESYGITDSVSAITNILHNMSGDVQDYKAWLTGDDKDNIVIC